MLPRYTYIRELHEDTRYNLYKISGNFIKPQDCSSSVEFYGNTCHESFELKGGTYPRRGKKDFESN